jgi:F-type H+-transporting ATPase subunit b
MVVYRKEHIMRHRSLFPAAICLGGLFMLAVCQSPVWSEEPTAEIAAEQDLGDGHSPGDEHGSGDDHSPPNPVSVDPDLAIVTAIIFVALLAVLWKFAWGPIVTAIDAREKSMADNLAEAARSNEQAKQLLEEHQTKLAAAAADVRQMLDDAKKDAEYHKQKILDQAQEAAQSEKERALREIESAKNAALESLAQTSVDTAVDLAGKIVKRQLSSSDHSQLIGEALQNFPSKN